MKRKLSKTIAEPNLDAALIALAAERKRRGGKSIPHSVFWKMVKALPPLHPLPGPLES